MKLFLGIELGSTRIKSVITDEKFRVCATGAYEWENRLEDGLWTYSLEDVWTGVKASASECMAAAAGTFAKGGRLCGIGVSAMMHGYLAFDSVGRLLVPFRTWRNTTTEQAAVALTELFNFNIPQRWSVAHWYQAILNGEAHCGEISFMTTLAGYVHWKLSGKKVLGVGDASGMFPVEDGEYNPHFCALFEETAGENIIEKFPKILNAGDDAGTLTAEGAGLLGIGPLYIGVPLCPPEGDAGTGMVATNAVREKTGNVSAGTSIFAMIVLEKGLRNLHTEIDMVVTPAGKPVAMVHCNNCTSDIDAWVRLFAEGMARFGVMPDKADLYEKMYAAALEGDADCGGLLSYNYVSGEPVVGLHEGRPMFLRMAGANFSFANFMRAHLFSCMATLRIGMDILYGEGVALEKLQGHGGLFKTPVVAQSLMAAALNTPVAVSQTAGEGGAWGMAILAAYADYVGSNTGRENLEDFLEKFVYVNDETTVAEPKSEDVAGFDAFLRRYKNGLALQEVKI